MSDFIILKNISHSFDDKKVLDGLNITINKGSFHSLVGVSGSGKSTTLKLISSLLPLSGGEIENTSKRISFAFQQSPLIPWLNVRDNLKICTKDVSSIDEYLKSFNLKEISSQFPAELSGGMIQKINILRSFLGNPDLILMDEPFVHIDSIQKEILHEFLLSLWNKNRPTIIFVTHDIDEALYLSQEISLFSIKRKNVTETLEISKKENSTYLDLKSSEDYPVYFKRIYNHLKQDQLI